jgi:hypothetical protein
MVLFSHLARTYNCLNTPLINNICSNHALNYQNHHVGVNNRKKSLKNYPRIKTYYSVEARNQAAIMVLMIHKQHTAAAPFYLYPVFGTDVLMDTTIQHSIFNERTLRTFVTI